jgi:hypothetical protein
VPTRAPGAYPWCVASRPTEKDVAAGGETGKANAPLIVERL